jgi:hypothetical protein
MFRAVLAAALILAPGAALAQDDAADLSSKQVKKVRSVVLFEGQQCPKAENDEEIVVCANTGESPYRIPQKFRDAQKYTPPATAWATRAQTVMEEGRVGLPNSCSPVGTGGATGCHRSRLDAWSAARAAQQAEQAEIDEPRGRAAPVGTLARQPLIPPPEDDEDEVETPEAEAPQG